MPALIKGKNDIYTVNEKLASEWNYERNGEITPSDIAIGSQKKVWWKCEKGHEWQATPHNRNYGTGCPYCSGRLPIKGENDLVTLFPDIAREWNFKKNQGLNPEDISYGSSKKVWWKCEKGHEWQSSLAHRVGGRGCPICKGDRSTSFPEQALFFYLRKMFPDAINRYKPSWLKSNTSALEIDIFIPGLKIGIEYDGQAFHSNKKRDEKKDKLVFEHGVILYRIREPLLPELETKSVCIYISEVKGRFYYQKAIEQLLKVLAKEYCVHQNFLVDISRDYSSILELYKNEEKEKSIAIKYPNLMEEWNYERNGEVDPLTISYGSNHLIWWRCNICHNEWQDSPKHRSSGRGCPLCGRRNGASKRTSNKIQKGTSITFEQWCQKNGEYGKKLLSEWAQENDKMPEDYTYSSNSKVLWKCSENHLFSATIGNRVGNKTTCPYCAGKATLQGYNDLATTNPEIVEDWDYEQNTILPTTVRAGSNKKVWWRCKKGHSYQAVIYNKTAHNTGCPYCSNTKVLEGYNDLASRYPELLDEWDYSKNPFLPSDVLFGTEKKAYWKCKSCGYEWYTAIAYRTSGAGCPRCAKSRAGKIARENDKRRK